MGETLNNDLYEELTNLDDEMKSLGECEILNCYGVYVMVFKCGAIYKWTRMYGWVLSVNHKKTNNISIAGKKIYRPRLYFIAFNNYKI